MFAYMTLVNENHVSNMTFEGLSRHRQECHESQQIRLVASL